MSRQVSGAEQAGANNATQLTPARLKAFCTRRWVPRIPTSLWAWQFRDLRTLLSSCRLDLILDTRTEVLRILDEVLSLGGRAMKFSAETPLLGAIPELDSMAVVALITTLEDRFGIMVDDDEISGDTFATVGSVTDFVAGKLGA